MSEVPVQIKGENDVSGHVLQHPPIGFTTIVSEKIIQEKILLVVGRLSNPTSTMSLKNNLSNWHSIPSNKANIRRIDRVLKRLTDEKRPDFGKLYDSYHGGRSSESFKNLSKLRKYNKVKDTTRKRMQEFHAKG